MKKGLLFAVLSMMLAIMLSASVCAAEEAVSVGDCNGDGKISTKDVVLLAQYIAGWDVELSGGVQTHVHTVVSVPDREASCEDVGCKDFSYCEVCEEILTGEVLDRLPHTPGEWKIENDYGCGGYEKSTICTVCKRELYEWVDGGGHDFTETVVEPTLTERGYTIYECKKCKETYTDSYVYIKGSEGLAYEVNPDGNSCIVTGIGSCTDTEITIPFEINGLRVVAIGEKAFENCTDITKINITGNVNEIGYRAFYGCTGITEFTIPENVNNIGAQIFYKCDNLSTVYLHIGDYLDFTTGFLNISSLKKVVFGGEYIPSSICEGCINITEVVIEEGVSDIGGSAFYGCTNLKTINIPDSVSAIYASAFENCSNLESIVIPESVNFIRHSAFSGCEALGEITIPNSVSAIESYTFNGCTSLKTVVLHDGIMSIGSSSFCECTSLEEITLPANIESIQYSTFEGCTALKSITIPGNVAKIDSWAFGGCSALENVVISEKIETLGLEPFYGCSALKDIYVPDVSVWFDLGIANGMTQGYNLYIGGELAEEITIPGSIEKIPSYAFVGCGSLTSVIISDGVTSIGESAFEKCTNLASVIISDSVTSIGESAFRNCTSLISVVISEGIETIGVNAFEGCTSLTSIVIPKSVTTIGNYAFHGCTALESIVITGKIETFGRALFNGCSALKNIYVPDVSVWFDLGITSAILEGYNLYIGGELAEEITIPGSIEKIPSVAFTGCGSLTSVIISDGVTSIGVGAFRNCTNLASVKISGTVATIEPQAFYGCHKLTSIEIPNGVTTIGDFAFYTFASMNVVMPTSVTSIGGSAFDWAYVYYCGTEADFEKITFPDGSDIGAVYYYSETEPEEFGNTWHYVDGVPTIWS